MSLRAVYERLKADGYTYIAKEYIGGETAHKEPPTRLGSGYISKKWVYVNRREGMPTVVATGVVTIDEAIQLAISVEAMSQGSGYKGCKAKTKVCLCCGTRFISYTKAKYCCEDCRLAVGTAKRLRRRGFGDDEIRNINSRLIKKINMFLDRKENKK